jgi:membrane-associated phospholipid phosphatase
MRARPLKFVQITILILCIYSFLPAQTWDEFNNDLDYSWQAGEDLGHVILHPTDKDLTAFLFGTSAVITGYFFDEPVRTFSLSHQNTIAGKIAEIDNYYGHGKYMTTIPVLIYAGGFLSDNTDIQNTGLKLSQAVFYTGILTLFIKEFTGRSRPFLNEGKHHFEPLPLCSERRSFFSGHSSFSFAVSTVLANESDNLAWKILWYGAAGTAAGARIYHDKHWLSDTIAGALVGYAIGNFISRQAKKHDKKLRMLNETDRKNKNADIIFYFSIPLGK